VELKSLDELEELALAEAAPLPQEGKKYDRVALVAKRKAFEAKVPDRKGFFMARRIAAREMSRVRHDKLIVRAERRIALKKDRHVFNMSVKVFDDAVARIDFEIAELDKDQGRPLNEEAGEKPKPKRKSSSKSPRSKKGKDKSVRKSKRTRRSPAKYRESREASEEDESEEDSDSDWEGGDEVDDVDSLSSLNDQLSRLPAVPQRPVSVPMSAPVRAV